MNLPRSSGILLHFTSLPGSSGIGGLGRGAHGFIDFLVAAGQRVWQFLPIGPTDPVFGNSPYMSVSAFAGNPLLIDLEQLVSHGWLAADELASAPQLSEYVVEFDRVIEHHGRLLHKAFSDFCDQTVDGKKHAAFQAFCREAAWLDDYALFMSLRQEQRYRPWHAWPRPLAARHGPALDRERQRLARTMLYHQFIQFCFFVQWQELHRYATARGVTLMGDLPIYVGLDSADVWANQSCFMLGADRRPTHVAGVPPDYFSDTGQRWGNPLYRWCGAKGKPNDRLHDWWLARFRHLFGLMDLVRIDHFRGFESFWRIPATEKTAVNGRWVKGPGKPFFDAIAQQLGPLPIVAEDLGIITPEVAQLRLDLGFPGMKVLQFAFDNDPANSYLPHNYESTEWVIYTGTHDNNTTLGWFLGDVGSEEERQRIRQYANSGADHDIHWDLIRLALASVAGLAIIPMQDLLGFGEDCRMNTPSTGQGNWRWRCASRFFSPDLQNRLRILTYRYNRNGTD